MKTKFKSKLLGVAITAALAATSAQAVTVSNDGLGQVLLYPYYTVEGDYQTLLSVVNTTTRGKAVKVRFLESKNSREVLDFNLYLSPRDVWTGMITEDTVTGGAKIVVHSTETSCTVPLISTSIGGTGEQSFLKYGFDGSGESLADAASTEGFARTRSGYVEIIEMGDIEVGYTLTGGEDFLASVTHSTAGVLTAAECGAVVAEWQLEAAAFPAGGHSVPPLGTATNGLDDVSGGLMGTGTLINTKKGTDYSYDPVVLVGYNVGAALPQHTNPGNLKPSLAESDNTSQVVIVDQVTGAVTPRTTTWDSGVAAFDGVDAVSAALMRTNVINEYVVNPVIYGGTDWVLTFPTKRWYVDGVVNAVRPFTQTFAAGSCETIVMDFWDQEERKNAGTGKVMFSPKPKDGPGDSLCREANVLTFNNSKVLSSTQTTNVDVKTYAAGWMSLSFPVGAAGSTATIAQRDLAAPVKAAVAHQMVDLAPAALIYDGLPVIGFAVQQYVDSTATSVLGNYGGAYTHKYQRNIH